MPAECRLQGPAKNGDVLLPSRSRLGRSWASLRSVTPSPSTPWRIILSEWCVAQGLHFPLFAHLRQQKQLPTYSTRLNRSHPGSLLAGVGGVGRPFWRHTRGASPCILRAIIEGRLIATTLPKHIHGRIGQRALRSGMTGHAPVGTPRKKERQKSPGVGMWADGLSIY
ncbi:hypothetical protein GQ53DRAFT_333718 [Thozetella sp. PMI_491]|nr:hypothetical protein GQ53DRAFT_333718 [Thozetella sp. PMI_491]